jgi:hypothetical protein
MKQLLLSAACICVTLITLSLGLWPFYAPKNEVTWIKDHGLSFGKYGSVMSVGNLLASDPENERSCSIEIWLRPVSNGNSGTILAFYAPEKTIRFSLHQSIADLMLQSGTADHQEQASVTELYVDGVFRRMQPVFVTVTSGKRGTAVYVDGTLTRTATQLRLAANDCTGRLILGDSPLQSHCWPGQVRGLAIYYSELSAPKVLEHYAAWTNSGQPDLAVNERNVGLYLFNEGAGRVVQNHARSNLDLTIPDTYTVLDKVMLEPFWKEFNLSRGYWEGILKNIVGFVPFGFCFYAYFSQARNYRRALLITILSGAAVSLTIEVLQGYLPTRDSGTTDLITNTLGTFIGVLAYRRAEAHFATLPIRRTRCDPPPSS